MVVFLDQLSNQTERPDSDCKLARVDMARDLATIHHICVTHLPELQNLARTHNTIKKLVTVTEMHSKHKQRYMEMLS